MAYHNHDYQDDGNGPSGGYRGRGGGNQNAGWRRNSSRGGRGGGGWRGGGGGGGHQANYNQDGGHPNHNQGGPPWRQGRNGGRRGPNPHEGESHAPWAGRNVQPGPPPPTPPLTHDYTYQAYNDQRGGGRVRGRGRSRGRGGSQSHRHAPSAAVPNPFAPPAGGTCSWHDVLLPEIDSGGDTVMCSCGEGVPECFAKAFWKLKAECDTLRGHLLGQHSSSWPQQQQQQQYQHQHQHQPAWQRAQGDNQDLFGEYEL